MVVKLYGTNNVSFFGVSTLYIECASFLHPSRLARMETLFHIR